MKPNYTHWVDGIIYKNKPIDTIANLENEEFQMLIFALLDQRLYQDPAFDEIMHLVRTADPGMDDPHPNQPTDKEMCPHHPF